ncbi:hypothetical protein [Gorillibacterium timonense]|uniref:hypothetical protein n=1 Tax=Gorillibacterium timonense TaxID=1689269 RepID=UPI00071CA72B|nr:hypothetical protein [Gorillibacterium timonense]
MKIAMINGSPKLGKNNSGRLLKALEPLIQNGNELSHYKVNKTPLTEEQVQELCRMDVLVLSFPLYIDAIPSQLFRMLTVFEEYRKQDQEKDIYVYVILNNGFYEGKQNHIAMDIIKNWCARCGLHFGQGIGQGAGEMLDFMEKVPLGQGPLKNLGKAMDRLAQAILTRDSGDPMLFSPNFPRFAWRISADRGFWHPQAKKNGLKKKDLLRRLGE